MQIVTIYSMQSSIIAELSVVPTLKCGGSGIVVNKIFDSLLCKAHLPAQREWQLVGHRTTRVLPLCCLALVVNKVNTTVRQHPLL